MLLIILIIFVETIFLELHGDRNVKDDKAMIGGLGKIGDQSYVYWNSKRL